MTFEEAKPLAQQGIKITHQYFSEEEYMTMKGNLVVFEDGVEIFVQEWMQGKEWLSDGWSVYRN